MKKFFGILLAAVSALVLLPGCGGGGDEDNVYTMTGDDFKAGRKHFIIGGGGVGTLYVMPSLGGYQLEGSEKIDPNTKVVIAETVQSVEKLAKAQVAAINSPGSPLVLAICKYAVNYDPDTGLPTTAQLSINYDSPINNDTNTTTFFDRAQNDPNGGGGENQLRITFELHFADYTWKLVENAGDVAVDPDADTVPLSGDFAVGLGNNPAAEYKGF